MENVSKSVQKSSGADGARCPDCTKPVDLGGPCWLRISPTPERTRAWHLECRDRYLADLQKSATVAAEQREQFAAALAMLGQISDAAASADADCCQNCCAETLALIRDLVGK